MYAQKENDSFNSHELVKAVSHTLQRIDPRLMDHGERVAFIACELREEGKLPLSEELLFLLSVFHDIGAYKTDEIDRMVEFETSNVENHAVYGYLFLKYMSPLSEMAETILYHHTPWSELSKMPTAYRDYSALIHLADRADIAFLHRGNDEHYDMLMSELELFRPDYVDLLMRCYKRRNIFDRLFDGSYRDVNDHRFGKYNISAETALEFLKMLVFSIDFRSEFTVTHSVNTVTIALDIARHFGLDSADVQKIYLGALLHDVGKIAVPVEILESTGRLNPEQMDVMRTHAAETGKIIQGLVPEEICRIAQRHHEKLDGSGYPEGLKAAELNFNQRIVAVADVVSALSARRSYKESFPKEKTISIIRDMQRNQLDPKICDYVCEHYDEIMERTDNNRNEVIHRYRAMLSEYAKFSTVGAV